MINTPEKNSELKIKMLYFSKELLKEWLKNVKAFFLKMETIKNSILKEIRQSF